MRHDDIVALSGVTNELTGERIPPIIGTAEELGLRPNLGLATTRELLKEIKARGEALVGNEDGRIMARDMSALLSLMPKDILNYRAVDSQ
jgi:hypothetical protein